MNLIEIAKKDVLKPFGHTDVLLYYSIVSKKLKNFLKGKEIATKIWLPKSRIPFFLRRGSKLTPLYVEELSNVTKEFLKLRAEKELKDVKGKISKIQEKIWNYFVPRKLIDFFYATNNEQAGKPIDRIFFDIDRKNLGSEKAQKVAKLLVEKIKNDEELNQLIKFDIFIMWTGSSFHVYLMLKKKIPNSFYENYFAFKKEKSLESFTGRWAKKINEQVKFRVIGGHEKISGAITIDPSQTPSGKLARAPFSLHMKNAKEIDGIAVPLSEKQLRDKDLVKKLKRYDLKKVLQELDNLSKPIKSL